MIDTDLGLRNLDVVLGLENRIIYNIVDVINGNCRLKQALIKDTQFRSFACFHLPKRKISLRFPGTDEKLIEDIRVILILFYWIAQRGSNKDSKMQ